MYSSSNDPIDIVEVYIIEEGGIEVMGIILKLLLDDDDGVIITDVS